MSQSPLLESVKPHNPTRIDVDIATALHTGMLAAIAVQKAQESQSTGSKIMEGKKSAMKS